ncbi:antibiotic biosynthesis monooxygenase [Nostoc sp. CHAB 5715]|uniref:NmrA family NAD(P)-binding protein n=1 Tax=Nostoc sp. CHAB 5715 TaxID=2780400 RepID=UPI001E44BB30|nr:antibiotic biosynthesis monooxygenase [Nostoc sp. CHAB 5715]MCC5621375.1 antibiotic biosynthesis monooxygenase [Nostoc sp. CHAB 5715]
MTTKSTVLVVSSTGMLGSKIVAALLDKGNINVLAMVRSSNDSNEENRQKIDEMKAKGAVIVEGFISASYHKSLDGTKVVNYAQWKSQADWQAFTQDPQGAALGEKIKQVGIKASEASSYQVQRVIEA